MLSNCATVVRETRTRPRKLSITEFKNTVNLKVGDCYITSTGLQVSIAHYRMRAYIKWMSVCCGSEKHEQGRLRIATSDPGTKLTNFIELLSGLSRLKKRVNLHPFCKECVYEDDMKGLTEIQMSFLEVEIREQENRKARTRQEWKVSPNTSRERTIFAMVVRFSFCFYRIHEPNTVSGNKLQPTK